jgi:hypothetical protein
MAVFRFTLGPWVDDHGMRHALALVGRDVDSGAALVSLHHDWESDLYLYGYWGSGIFGKVFVTEVRGTRDHDPMWQINAIMLRYEPARPGDPSTAERALCIAQIADALSQCPDGDVSLAHPGVVVRRIEFKNDFQHTSP